MSYNNIKKLVAQPVSIKDSQAVFNTSSRDLGTIITNAIINKWSKYKPVVYPSVTGNNGGQGTVVDDGSTYQKYGLTAPLVTSSSDRAEAEAYYRDQGWVYTKPTGGITSPYRLSDFDGYSHNAQPFISIPYGYGYEGEFNLFTNGFNIDATTPDATQYPNCLYLSDFAPNAVLSAMLFKRDGNTTEYSYLWVPKSRIVASASNPLRLTVLNNSNNDMQDQLYYSLIFYLSVGNNRKLLIPWDNSHYYMYNFQALCLPFFTISFVRMITQTSQEVEFSGDRATLNSTLSTFTLMVHIGVTYGYNGLQRSLVFGSSSTDRIRLQVNGQGGMYEPQYVDSSGNAISSQTCNPGTGAAMSATLYLKFTNVPTSAWNIVSDNYQPNWIRLYVSHNSGGTWQSTNNPTFQNYAQLRY